MRNEVKSDVIPSKLAAMRLRISTDNLVAHHPSERLPLDGDQGAGKPGDKGKNRWGLTEDQFQAIIRGQVRGFATPREPEAVKAAGPAPGGVSRLRKRDYRVKLS